MLTMLLSQIAQGEWFIGLGILFILLPILWFVIAILLCIWVYRDAESRGFTETLNQEA